MCSRCSRIFFNIFGQMIYDYDPDDPARLEYMQDPEAHFGGEWVRTRLSTSFRLTRQLAALANAMDPDPPIRAGAGEGPMPCVITCDRMEWGQRLLKHVAEAARAAPPEKVAILARTVRAEFSRPLRLLVNALGRAGAKVHLHRDGADPRVAGGKLAVCTWHATKGMQYDAVIVVDVDAAAPRNALHVALTRSARHLLVVQDAARPHPDLLRAVAAGAARADEATLAARPRDPPPPPCFARARDMGVWTPRSATEAKMDASPRDDVSEPDLPAMVVQAGAGFEDVTGLMLRAALLSLEHAATGSCARFAPAERTEVMATAVLANPASHFVDARIGEAELLPPHASRALARFRHSPPRSPSEWGSAAAILAARGGFHNRLPALAGGGWVDPVLFSEVRSRIARALGPSPRFDVGLSREAGGDALYARADAIDHEGTAWKVVYGDASPLSHAALPLLLAPGLVSRCAVLNVQTARAVEVSVRDPDEVWGAL